MKSFNGPAGMSEHDEKTDSRFPRCCKPRHPHRPRGNRHSKSHTVRSHPAQGTRASRQRPGGSPAGVRASLAFLRNSAATKSCAALGQGSDGGGLSGRRHAAQAAGGAQFRNSSNHRQRAPRPFYREARLAATLRHPNLCPITMWGIPGTHFISMAYIEGNRSMRS